MRPMGMLIQKMDRHPMEPTSRPPMTGPSAMLNPMTAPQTPIACARSLGSVNVLVMIDMATGLSIEPPMAWTMRNTTKSGQVGGQAAEEGAGHEGHEADHEGLAPAKSVRHRSREHQQAGQDQGVGVDGPLQAGDRGVQVLPDGGEGDVDDGHVEAHDQEAHGADEEDADAPAATQLVDRPWGRRSYL